VKLQKEFNLATMGHAFLMLYKKLEKNNATLIRMKK